MELFSTKFIIMVSLDVLTSITLTSIPLQTVKGQSNGKCISFKIIDEDITSERSTVQEKDPSITDITCIDGNVQIKSLRNQP